MGALGALVVAQWPKNKFGQKSKALDSTPKGEAKPLLS